MIRDMRRGHVPSVERLRSLCQVLDLDFFVGPRRLRREAREGAPDVLLSTLEHTAQDLAQLTADAGGNPVSDDLWPVLAARRAVAAPQPESESVPAASSPWSGPPPPNEVAKADMKLEALDWKILGKPEGFAARFLMGKLAERTRYLDPDDCFLVEIRDGYMAPTLPNGSVVLVDGASTDWQPPRIMAVRIEDDVVARRAALGDDGRRLLSNDHPDWPDVPLPAGAEVVGEILWVANWLNRAAPADDQAETVPPLTPSEDKGKKTE